MKKIFILSTGRTGTKFISKYFDANWDVITSVHEPYISRALRVFSNMYLHNKISDRTMSKIFKNYLNLVTKNKTTPIYIESNPYLHGFIYFISKQDPSSIIIHIVRDPRTYIRSYINWGVFRGKRLLAVKFIPYWFLKPAKKLDDEYDEKWEDLSNARKIAWRWRIINSFISSVGQRIDNYFLFRFEYIMQGESSAELKRLLEVLELDTNKSNNAITFKNKINVSKNRTLEEWQNWDNQERKDVLGICGQLMQIYGYVNEKDFQNL